MVWEVILENCLLRSYSVDLSVLKVTTEELECQSVTKVSVKECHEPSGFNLSTRKTLVVDISNIRSTRRLTNRRKNKRPACDSIYFTLKWLLKGNRKKWVNLEKLQNFMFVWWKSSHKRWIVGDCIILTYYKRVNKSLILVRNLVKNLENRLNLTKFAQGFDRRPAFLYHSR